MEEDLIERLSQPIIAVAYERGHIMNMELGERLIRERGDAADVLKAQGKRIQELEDELQVAVVVHKKLEEQIDAFEMDAGHAAARIKELEERIAFMEASAAPEKTIDILIK